MGYPGVAVASHKTGEVGFGVYSYMNMGVNNAGSDIFIVVIKYRRSRGSLFCRLFIFAGRGYPAAFQQKRGVRCRLSSPSVYQGSASDQGIFTHIKSPLSSYKNSQNHFFCEHYRMYNMNKMFSYRPKICRTNIDRLRLY